MYKIIISPFPFLETSISKVRPLVVLAQNIEGLCICGFLTSHIPAALLDTDVLIKHSPDAQIITGLQKDSILRLHKLGSIDTDLIQQEIGNLPESLELEVKAKIKDLFGVFN